MQSNIWDTRHSNLTSLTYTHTHTHTHPHTRATINLGMNCQYLPLLSNDAARRCSTFHSLSLLLRFFEQGLAILLNSVRGGYVVGSPSGIPARLGKFLPAIPNTSGAEGAMGWVFLFLPLLLSLSGAMTLEVFQHIRPKGRTGDRDYSTSLPLPSFPSLFLFNFPFHILLLVSIFLSLPDRCGGLFVIYTRVNRHSSCWPSDGMFSFEELLLVPTPQGANCVQGMDDGES